MTAVDSRAMHAPALGAVQTCGLLCPFRVEPACSSRIVASNLKLAGRPNILSSRRQLQRAVIRALQWHRSSSPAPTAAVAAAAAASTAPPAPAPAQVAGSAAAGALTAAGRSTAATTAAVHRTTRSRSVSSSRRGPQAGTPSLPGTRPVWAAPCRRTATPRQPPPRCGLFRYATNRA